MVSTVVGTTNESDTGELQQICRNYGRAARGLHEWSAFAFAGAIKMYATTNEFRQDAPQRPVLSYTGTYDNRSEVGDICFHEPPLFVRSRPTTKAKQPPSNAREPPRGSVWGRREGPLACCPSITAFSLGGPEFP